MGLRKKLAALVLAIASLGVFVQPAQANNTMGFRFVDWEGHGNVTAEFYMHSEDPRAGTAYIEGILGIIDEGAPNIDHIYISSVRLWVRRNNGTIEVPTAIGTGPDLPAVLAGAPLNKYNLATHEIWGTRNAGCRHPNVEPDGVLDGNDVWVVATYRIYWRDGTQTALRSDSSNEVTIADQTFCN